MRVFLLIGCLICLSTGLFAQFSFGLGAVAASQPVTNADGDGSRIGYGAQLKLDYQIATGVYIAPDFQYYVPGKTDNDEGSYYMSANLNLQYDLLDNEYNRGYIFGGGTFVRPGVEGTVEINGQPQPDKIRIDWEEVGFNIGLGAEQNMGIYTEIRYQHTFFLGDNVLQIEPRSQIILGLGYRFKGKKKETVDEAVGML